MHEPKAVDGLIAAYQTAGDKALQANILTTLARLYKKEAPYQGQTWWSTRPDGHGPYYNAVEWEASPAIKKILTEEWKSRAPEKQLFADLNARYQMGIAEFGGEEALAAKEEPKIDLEKIRNKKGQIGESSIEDVMLAMANIAGNANLGKKLFVNQGCVACHSINKGDPLKGPFMGTDRIDNEPGANC
jgi:mono/diheme cytochrome c family protein